MHITRRQGVAAVLGVAATAARAATPTDPAPGPIWQFRMTSIEEGALDFADFRGKVLLVVNTASFCSFTPQYKQLEALHRDLGPKGFAVIGIPSQDFGQEKDSNGAVKEFCELTYGVDFPMSAIAHVKGPEAAPVYKWVRAQLQWEPRWNFNKVLVGRDGAILGAYGSEDLPDAGRLQQSIAEALAQTA